MQCYIIGFLNANKMKTAIQELIDDELNGDTKSIDYYLELEKQQIIEAYNHSLNTGGFTANEYYQYTFGDNTEAGI